MTVLSLDPLTSDLLDGVSHGFFTRRGGASSGVFEGLNCGYGSSDQAEVVALNRSRAAGSLGVPADLLVSAHQTHSATALVVDGPLGDPKPQADALVTATPGIAVAVLTADCQPVLMADTQAGVVAAAHAGWRGALSGILEATIEAMESIGADRARIKAAIGPSISQRAYEVGPEFLDEFLADDTDNQMFFANGAAEKFQFDLQGYGLKRLRDAGVAAAEWTRHCTYTAPDLFYSYRRARHQGQADYGRLLSAIRV